MMFVLTLVFTVAFILIFDEVLPKREVKVDSLKDNNFWDGPTKISGNISSDLTKVI